MEIALESGSLLELEKPPLVVSVFAGTARVEKQCWVPPYLSGELAMGVRVLHELRRLWTEA
jgi:hypothetical protein